MIKFIEETHQYFVDGEEYPSVTRILAPLISFSFVEPAVLENARQRGTAIHRMINLVVGDNLDEEKTDERLVPYLSAWKWFTHLYQPKVLCSEKIVFSEKHKFAGTIDMVAMIHGKRVLIDIKSSKASLEIAGLQTAAYQLAEEESSVGKIDDRWIFIPKRDSKFEVIKRSSKCDKQKFLNQLKEYKNAIR